jgi:hypothetical protein
MSTISAGTTSGTALVNTGDTTGNLVLQTNGTTTALTLGTDQSATFAGAASVGTRLTAIGTASVAGLKIADVLETASVSTIAATGTITYDVTTQVVLFYTINASGNWTVNFRGSSGTSLNSLMTTGESLTAAFLVTQGATAFFNSAVQVDGTTSGVTTRWQGGTAPAAGNASGVDAYTYTIIKTANATFSVFAAQTRFA